MAFDFSVVANNITPDTVMFVGLAFFSGMAAVMSYHRLHHRFEKAGYRPDETVTEAIVMEYSRRLRDYDRVIAELRTKVDIMELRAETPKSVISHQLQTSHESQPHTSRVMEPPVITQHATLEAEPERQDGQNGTTDYILKMLAERPRTSREVQQAVGRTREHTARLMKKLTGSQFVARDTSAKPFRYNLTDLGRERLREKVEVASGLWNR